MLWKTHLRISFEVLKRLDIELSPQVEKKFRDGIVAPDQWKDYPHHHGKSEKIKKYLLKSRKCFLQNDYPNTFFNLGVALHYIQDSHTSFASFYPKHHSWEESIHNSYFASDLKKTINYFLKDKAWERERCLRLAEALSKNTLSRDNTLYLATLSGHEASKSFAKPAVDLNLALRASYVVTEAVLSPKRCSALENKLREEHSNHQVLLRSTELELANKVTRLVEEKKNLQKRKVPSSGFVSKIKNGILAIRIKLKDLSVNSNYKDYTKKKHLEKGIRDYTKAANITVAPYQGWNLFQIPQLDASFVNKELLTIQEVAVALSQQKSVLKELLAKAQLSVYKIGNTSLIRRAELDSYLSHYPVNGFVKCPCQTLSV